MMLDVDIAAVSRRAAALERCGDCTHLALMHQPSTGICTTCAHAGGGTCAVDRSTVAAVRREPHSPFLVIGAPLEAMTDEDWREVHAEAIAAGEIEPAPYFDPSAGPIATDPNQRLIDEAAYRARVVNFGAARSLIHGASLERNDDNRVTADMLSKREAWVPGQRSGSNGGGGGKSSNRRRRPVKRSGRIAMGPDAGDAVSLNSHLPRVLVPDIDVAVDDYFDRHHGEDQDVLVDLAARIEKRDLPAFVLSPRLRCVDEFRNRNGRHVYAPRGAIDLVRVYPGALRKALTMHAWEHGGDRIAAILLAEQSRRAERLEKRRAAQ